MIDIQIISGTDRPGSNALRISKYLQSKYERKGVTAGIIDLQKFPIEKIAGGRYKEKLPSVSTFNDRVVSADGLVIACPEYNGGYPGILKLFIDYLPFPESLNKKPVAMVGEADGAFGAIRAVEQLQQVIHYRNGHVFPERVFIPRVNKNFGDELGIRNKFQQQLLESQISNFVQFVTDLKDKQAEMEV